MRAIVVGAVLALTVAVMWSCTVNTRSDKLACSTQADCGSSGRACENGYCVVDPNAKFDAAIDAKQIDAFVCPSECNGGCAGTTCMINGTGAPVTCPPGFACTITCSTAGACGDITCTSAASCDVTCGIEGACGNITCSSGACTVNCTGSGGGSGSATACGDLTCGTGKCTETCTGSGACGNTSCAQSCDCNVTCNPSAGACGTMMCPQANPTHYCSMGQVPGGACDSHVFGGCIKTCP